MNKYKFTYTIIFHGFVDSQEVLSHTSCGEVTILADNLEIAKEKLFVALKRGYSTFNYKHIEENEK